MHTSSSKITSSDSLYISKNWEDIPVEPGTQIEYSSEEEIEKIRDNYHTWISKKRDYALDYDRFRNHILYHCVYYRLGDSYIFGNTVEVGNEITLFVPTHFAPATAKEGTVLIAKLASYNNVVFTVLDDMVNMLERLGFSTTGIHLPSTFGDSDVEKCILVSNKNWFENRQSEIMHYYLSGESSRYITYDEQTISDSPYKYEEANHENDQLLHAIRLLGHKGKNTHYVHELLDVLK